jgi:hypothetical protein
MIKVEEWLIANHLNGMSRILKELREFLDVLIEDVDATMKAHKRGEVRIGRK